MSRTEALRPRAWVGVEEAAAFLGVPAVTLRRSLERTARRSNDGAVTAQVDGITARKLGRLWRLWLDAGWINPPIKK
jgi:hypothetical protein